MGVGFCSVHFGMFSIIFGLYIIGANCIPHPYYSSQREGVGLCPDHNLVDCAILRETCNIPRQPSLESSGSVSTEVVLDRSERCGLLPLLSAFSLAIPGLCA